MKLTKLFFTILSIILCCGYLKSQNSVTSHTVPAVKSSNQNLKFIGKYNLQKISKSDTLIVYDYIEIFEKGGQLLCRRDIEHNFYSAELKVMHKKYNRHFDCQLVKIDEKNKTIVIKYIDREYVYKFIKNKNNNYEIIIVDKALVYEKK